MQAFRITVFTLMALGTYAYVAWGRWGKTHDWRDSLTYPVRLMWFFLTGGAGA